MRPRHAVDSARCRGWRTVNVRRPRPQAAAGADGAPPPAGIPTCPPLTPAGDRLMAALLADKPADAVMRDALAEAETAGAAGATGGGSDDDTVTTTLSPSRIAAEAALTDIVYALALACAYVWSDGVLQAEGGTAARPQTAWSPVSAAVLLAPGAGAYSLGSFAFERVDGPGDQAGGVTWGGADSAAAVAAAEASTDDPPLPRPPKLEDVLESAAAAALLRDEGDTPARLDVDGAARTFRLYLAWGYSCSAVFRPAVLAGERGQPRSGAARRAADRHVGALFGSGAGGDTITTLARWRHMTCEARRYGGALADAEAVVLAAAARGKGG